MRAGAGMAVVQRDLEHGLSASPAYAEGTPAKGTRDPLRMAGEVVVMQRNWIGRSDGAVSRSRWPMPTSASENFTTRIDTIYGATFVLLAPEHALVESNLRMRARIRRRSTPRWKFRALDREARLTWRHRKGRASTPAERPSTRSPAGSLPILGANFVPRRIRTGAIMAVPPAHDQRDFESARSTAARAHRRARAEGDTRTADELMEAAPAPAGA